MPTANPATILFIDDKESELRLLAEHIRGVAAADARVLAPEQVELADLEWANLVVVDYELGDWISALQGPISAIPLNGIAVASILREHVAKIRNFPPTGFALITGQADRVCPVPSERRPHVQSRLSNLEWFFEKGLVETNATPIVALARAVQMLPESISELGEVELLGSSDSTVRGVVKWGTCGF